MVCVAVWAVAVAVAVAVYWLCAWHVLVMCLAVCHECQLDSCVHASRERANE